MKRLFLIFTLVILTAAMLLSVSCTSHPGGGATVDYTGFKVGNTWIYQVEEVRGEDDSRKNIFEETRRITGMADVNRISCFVMETLSQDEINFRGYLQVKPEEGVFLLQQENKVLDPATKKLKFVSSKVEPPLMLMKLPLKRGATWNQQIKRGQSLFNLVFLVKGEEEVETPAGKFKAMQVESHGGTTDGFEFDSKQWFAPDLGTVKEIQSGKQGSNTIITTVLLKEFKKEAVKKDEVK